MSFNEDAWLASVEKLDQQHQHNSDLGAVISTLKQLFEAPESYLESLNARLDSAIQTGRFVRDIKEFDACLQDVNEIETVYTLGGERVLDGVLPDGTPIAAAILGIYFDLLEDLRDFEREAGGKKEGKKEDKKEDKKDSGNESKKDGKEGVQQEGVSLGGGSGRGFAGGHRAPGGIGGRIPGTYGGGFRW